MPPRTGTTQRRLPLPWLVVGFLAAAIGVLVGVLLLNPQAGPNATASLHAPSLREAMPVPPVRFTDVTETAGVRFQHTNGASGRKLLPETMGSGVAVFDYNGDGRQDLLFVNSCDWPGATTTGPRPTLALYRNRGDWAFEDVTDAAGLNVTFYGMGVTVGDYDNDGRPDIFVSAVGGHRLFHNQDGRRFTDVTDSAGVGGGGRLPDGSRADFLAGAKPIPFGASCTFLDYDGDGRLDLFVCHYVVWSPRIDLAIDATLLGRGRAFVPPRDFDGAQCSLFRNVDGKHFEDVSEMAGVWVSEPEGFGPNSRRRPVGKALGVIVCDPDEDGWPDIVVANDTVRNFFFRNVGLSGARRFEEKGYEAAAAYADEGRPRGGMGIDWGEYRPGKSAVVIANFANEPNTFLSLDRSRPPLFADSALSVGMSGPSRGPLKFGTFFFDCDLDGRLDLLTCNGHIEPDIATVQAGQTFAQPAQLFWNTGVAGRLFEPVTARDAGTDLFKPLVGRGSAFGDLDGDGDLDVVLTANGGPARVLRNDGKSGNGWVRLVLKGDGVKSNVSAIGAQVTVEAGGVVMRRPVTGGRGYLSQSELPISVGLGSAAKVDRVTVRWPGRDAGPPEVWTDLAAGQTHELRQGESRQR